MTQQTFAAPSPAAAAARAHLARLDRCGQVRPFQAGDDDLLCASDGFHIVWNRGHWEHDPEEIRACREAAAEGVWP